MYKQDTINCMWSQVINDPTTIFKGWTFNPTTQTTILDFLCRDTHMQFTIQGKATNTLDEMDKLIHFKKSTIISIRITRLQQE